jgi:DNA-binding transcriptional ArsR family regulator
VPSTPPVPHPLPDALVDLIAQRFRVLGEPMRIKLLDRLRDGEATVGELQEATGATQQNVSKHLGVLLGAGMVSRTKQGNRASYAIADEAVFELCSVVCGGLRRELSELDHLLQGGTQR